jgi:membrane-associated phospholipid phosphatase
VGDLAALRRVVSSLAPMALVPLLYRAMGRFRDVGLSPARVHLCDLRDLEARWLGVVTDGRTGTVHDWLQRHASPVLDGLCAVPYATFLLACVAFGVFATLRDPARGRRFAWGFLALNVAGFVTYHLAPTAPPWYFHAHGCVVDLSTAASEGPNLARVDLRLGVPLFASMYARSSAVFGAMPSLHCAYALFIVLEGWPLFGRHGRAAAVAFAALMAFSAVYLDHHWIADVLAGQAYAVAVFLVSRRLQTRSRVVALASS